MHFVHSFWSKPLDRQEYQNFKYNKKDTFIICNALSVAWINHLGGKINLYVDINGQKIKYFLTINIYI